MISQDSIMEALATVDDPEIKRPITDLGMVQDITIDAGHVTVQILLTTAGCPLRDTITSEVEKAVLKVDSVEKVTVSMGVMSDEQKKELRKKLGNTGEREIPFNKPDNLTRVIAVASGKGGVGKSSVAANLAVALTQQGLKVGVLDADIYGFSLPRMLGVTTEPQSVDGMIIPPLGAHGVKVISIGMFVAEGQPIIWRGPMLHRAIEQFLADVFWGDLDVLLLDMPPGTGDVAISVGQLLPEAEILVVTTPQVAAAEVAERSGAVSSQTRQKVIGVVENMSYMTDSNGNKVEVFGSGGGKTVSSHLTSLLGYEVPLMTQIPLDIELRKGSDTGTPSVSNADAPSAEAIRTLGEKVSKSNRNLAGRHLGVTNVR